MAVNMINIHGSDNKMIIGIVLSNNIDAATVTKKTIPINHNFI